MVDLGSKDGFLKSLLIIAIILNIAFCSFTMLFSIPRYRSKYVPYPDSNSFVVGIAESPKALDPINSLDTGSNTVIRQVAECLFWYNLTDPTLSLEPLLAESYNWNETAPILTVNIRDQIYFHDGSKLDAFAVKWNLDRILYFTNATGELPAGTTLASSSAIYFLLDGITSIINRTEIIDELTVKIVLNQPFASFIPLLSHVTSSIVSPASHSNSTYIDLANDKLIGTGPFVYYYYAKDTEVRLYRWDNYWRKPAYFDDVVFAFIKDDATRNNAMLGHTIDYLIGLIASFLPTFIADETITVVETGTDQKYRYMAFDNFRINSTWREAISKAFNYTYMIEVIHQGNVVRGPPCVPSGMPGYNASVVVALQNIPEARITMQRMGFGVGWEVGSQIGELFTPGAHELNWSDATFFTDEFGHPLDVNYHEGSEINRKLNDLLFYDLDKIGINTNETTRTKEKYITDGENGLLRGMWFDEKSSDYTDAYNMLSLLFNPNSTLNYCNLTDSQVFSWFATAREEVNLTERYELLGNLQYRLFEVLYAHIPLWANATVAVHSRDIKGCSYNHLDNFLVIPMYRD